MKRMHGWALASLLGMPLAVLAQAPAQQPQAAPAYDQHLSYTYGDARLVIEDPEGGGDELTGLRLGASAQFHPSLFVTGALTTLSSDGADLDTLDVGLGFRNAIGPNTDVVGIIGLIWADLDAGRFGGDDDTGLSLTGGVRGWVGPRFEAGGYASYVELFGDGDASLVGEGIVHMTPQLALVGSLGLSDDVTVLTLGARWNFRAPSSGQGT